MNDIIPPSPPAIISFNSKFLSSHFSFIKDITIINSKAIKDQYHSNFPNKQTNQPPTRKCNSLSVPNFLTIKSVMLFIKLLKIQYIHYNYSL